MELPDQEDLVSPGNPEDADPWADALSGVGALLRAALSRARDVDAPLPAPVPWSDVLASAPLFTPLVRAFDLQPASAALLSLSIAPALSHRIACGYAVLRHDPDSPMLSLGVVMELLGLDGAARCAELVRALQPGSPLIDLELVVAPLEGPCTMRDNVAPSPRILAFVSGYATLPDDLRSSCTLHATGRLRDPVLRAATAAGCQEAVAQVTRSVESADPTGAPVCILTGPRGSGRGLIASHLANAAQRPILRADGHALPGDDPTRCLAWARRVVREARLQNAWLHLEGLDTWDGRADRPLSQLLETYAPFFSLGAESPLAGRDLVPHARHVIHLDLPRPGPRERVLLWQQHVPRHVEIPLEQMEVAAHRYPLTGGAIARAIDLAAQRALSRNEERLSMEALEAAVRASVAQTLSAVAREVHPTESWHDLVAGDDTRILLHVMMANFRHRRKVYDEWGFGERFGRGLGLSALFSGPPGTGKTMAAGILARELGLPLFQVELGSVVSKWVGETEKNLDRVFAEAEAIGAVLLFDEADSLFARRTEVSSANDRYANLEVNHLLQRVEAFDGVVVLTTNNASSLDQAFMRRFAYHLHFPVPEEEHRAELWKKLIPQAADVAPDLNFAKLAKDYHLSGGHIKNAVLRAAFFAAELGRPIDTTLLELTAKLELKQLGTAVRHLDVAGLWQTLQDRGASAPPSQDRGASAPPSQDRGASAPPSQDRGASPPASSGQRPG